jgi:hypothetical protein
LLASLPAGRIGRINQGRKSFLFLFFKKKYFLASLVLVDISGVFCGDRRETMGRDMRKTSRNGIHRELMRTRSWIWAVVLSVAPFAPALADPGDALGTRCGGIACQYVQHAAIEMSHDRRTAAVEFCNRALAIYRNYMDAPFYRGRAEIASGLYDAAQSDFDAIVAAHPEFASPYVYRGITYLRQHKPQQAVVELNKAMSANTGIGSLLAANVYIYWGLAFEELGRGSDAVADLTDALKTINGDEHDWTAFGFGCYNAAVMGLIDTASMYCDESIKRQSRNELAYNARGHLSIKSGQFGQAVADFTKALYYQDDNTEEKSTASTRLHDRE